MILYAHIGLLSVSSFSAGHLLNFLCTDATKGGLAFPGGKEGEELAMPSMPSRRFGGQIHGSFGVPNWDFRCQVLFFAIILISFPVKFQNLIEFMT